MSTLTHIKRMRRRSDGALGFYFSDGAEYVPGLDAGQYTVWHDSIDPEWPYHRANNYWTRDEMLRSWEPVPDDEASVSVKTALRLLTDYYWPQRWDK